MYLYHSNITSFNLLNNTKFANFLEVEKHLGIESGTLRDYLSTLKTESKSAKIEPKQKPIQSTFETSTVSNEIPQNVKLESVKIEPIKPIPVHQNLGLENMFSNFILQTIETNNTVLIDLINDKLKDIKPTEVYKPTYFINNLEVETMKGKIVHKDFEFVAQLVIDGTLPPLLVGSAGTGKSQIAESISILLDKPFYSESITMQTAQSSFFGYFTANGDFLETNFYKAYTQGGIYLLDEVDRGNPNTLLALNNVISSKQFTFGNGTKEKHPDFRFIATANTYGNGGNLEYLGANKLDKAFLDRFIMLTIDYDKEMERKLIQDDEVVNFCHNFRHKVESKGIREVISIRAMQKIVMLKKVYKGQLTLTEIAKSVFCYSTDLLNLL